MMLTVLLLIAAADAKSPVSCGAACVYLFVRDTKPELNLSTVNDLLRDQPDGHSFADLATAVESLGISTSVLNVKESGRLPNGPFIAHFQSADGDGVGHFVFLRPLEPTFTQYQMIAAPFQPEVAFASDLLARTDFTGWVMTHRSANLSSWIGALLLVSGIGFLVLHFFFARRRPLMLAPQNAAPTR